MIWFFNKENYSHHKKTSIIPFPQQENKNQNSFECLEFRPISVQLDCNLLQNGLLKMLVRSNFKKSLYLKIVEMSEHIRRHKSQILVVNLIWLASIIS